MTNVLVAVQVAAMIGVGLLWANDGDYRRAGVQALYCAATVILFAK